MSLARCCFWTGSRPLWRFTNPPRIVWTSLTETSQCYNRAVIHKTGSAPAPLSVWKLERSWEILREQRTLNCHLRWPQTSQHRKKKVKKKKDCLSELAANLPGATISKLTAILTWEHEAHANFCLSSFRTKTQEMIAATKELQRHISDSE